MDSSSLLPPIAPEKYRPAIVPPPMKTIKMSIATRISIVERPESPPPDCWSATESPSSSTSGMLVSGAFIVGTSISMCSGVALSHPSASTAFTDRVR